MSFQVSTLIFKQMLSVSHDISYQLHSPSVAWPQIWSPHVVLLILYDP